MVALESILAVFAPHHIYAHNPLSETLRVAPTWEAAICIATQDSARLLRCHRIYSNCSNGAIFILTFVVLDLISLKVLVLTLFILFLSSFS